MPCARLRAAHRLRGRPCLRCRRSRPPRRRFGVARWVSSWVFPCGPGFVFSGILIPQLRWEIPAIGDAGASDWAGMCQTARYCPVVLDLRLCLRTKTNREHRGSTGLFGRFMQLKSPKRRRRAGRVGPGGRGGGAAAERG